MKGKDSSENIRLVDNGFSLICDVVNDISMTVRIQAAALLVSSIFNYLSSHKYFSHMMKDCVKLCTSMPYLMS